MRKQYKSLLFSDYFHDLQTKATHMHNTLSLICNFATLTYPPMLNLPPEVGQDPPESKGGSPIDLGWGVGRERPERAFCLTKVPTI